MLKKGRGDIVFGCAYFNFLVYSVISKLLDQSFSRRDDDGGVFCFVCDDLEWHV